MNPVASQNVCAACEQAIRHGSGRLDSVPGLIKRIIKEELWRERRVGIQVFKLNSFRELIVSEAPAGWGESTEKVEAIIRSDADALAMWRKAITPEIGVNQHTKGHDNVMTQQGNSRGYATARLKRERPDLFAQVVAKKLTANAAAIKAGWRKKKTPLEQLHYWWGKASMDEHKEFLKSHRP